MLQYVSNTGKVISKSEIGTKLVLRFGMIRRSRLSCEAALVRLDNLQYVLVLSAVKGQQYFASSSMPHSCIIVRLEPDGREGRWRTLRSGRLDIRWWVASHAPGFAEERWWPFYGLQRETPERLLAFARPLGSLKQSIYRVQKRPAMCLS
jgi:hypothetical protein